MEAESGYLLISSLRTPASSFCPPWFMGTCPYRVPIPQSVTHLMYFTISGRHLCKLCQYSCRIAQIQTILSLSISHRSLLWRWIYGIQRGKSSFSFLFGSFNSRFMYQKAAIASNYVSLYQWNYDNALTYNQNVIAACYRSFIAHHKKKKLTTRLRNNRRSGLNYLAVLIGCRYSFNHGYDCELRLRMKKTRSVDSRLHAT